MNAQVARQQANQRKVATRKRSNALTAANRQQAVSSLVRCLETNPSRQEWSEITDSVLLGLWPNFKTLPHDELMSALTAWTAAIKDARAIVRAKLSPEQLLLNPLALEPVLDATPDHHQAAVNSLVELSMSTPDFCASFPGTQPVLPFDQVPALFRVAIQEAKAAASRNPYPEETDLIEHALMLIERNGGDAHIRTPELDEFLSSLLISPVDDHFRVTYSPSDTVH